MTPKKETQVTEIKEQPIQGEAEILISQAISQNISVESLEKLLAMRRELKAEKAKEAFNTAMATFQSECPIIKKEKHVDFPNKSGGRTKYSYAPIESIVAQVKGLLMEHGFSYAINTKMNGSLTVICRAIHKEGHSEESEFSVPINTESKMNVQQQTASALTYAKRYAFCNAFGILTGDDDDDTTSIPSQPQSSPNVPQNKPETTKESTTDSVLGSCPACGNELVEAKMKNGTPYLKCSTNVWNPQTRQASGCRYVKWDKKIEPQKPSIEDESQYIPNPEE